MEDGGAISLTWDNGNEWKGDFYEDNSLIFVNSYGNQIKLQLAK
jgi:hypothetical protein